VRHPLEDEARGSVHHLATFIAKPVLEE
jgi:hypothetical protein